MTHEQTVKKLQGRLRQLDAKRAEVKAKLDAIMRQHIETQRIAADPGAQGDAALFNRMTKGRLMQIIEDHWRVHHMFAITAFEAWTKEEMVNYVLDIKGLAGSYVKPKTREYKPSVRRDLSNIIW